MSRREFVVIWAAAFAYTAYVCGEIAGLLALLGHTWGTVIGLVLAFGPVLVWMYVTLVSR